MSKTLEFARKHIKFDRASLISGNFDDARYPHLRKPLSANDDIETKSLVIYKSAGCMGTVFLQIVIAKHILCDVGDVYFVAQTDDDAKTWGVARGQGFILSIPDIWRLRRASMIERSCFKQDQWSFRHLDFYITGPGKTARQSKQVRLVLTDESHLEENFEDGALKEFDDRRQRWGWGGRSVHATTAASAGAEVDRMYYEGRQNEYHWKCPHCSELIWPLWRDITPTHKHAEEVYGKDIFLWEEKETEDDTLDSIRVRCPHCEAVFQDTFQDRTSLIGDDYVAMNPNAKKGYDSFRWSVFAVADIEWRKVFSTYREAMKAAQNGNLQLLENFAKKQLCASYTPVVPDFSGTVKSSFGVGEGYEVVENELRVASFDFQEGKSGEGLHWWFQADTWLKDGSSRRLDYRKLLSWADCRAAQEHFRIKDGDVFIDAGHRDKEVYGRCAAWHWYATIASDDEVFYHTVKTGENKTEQIPHPYYTQTRIQSSTTGVNNLRHAIPGRGLPPGYCYSRAWSKTNTGFLLLRLKSGLLGAEYGIPHNIDSEYTKQLNSYMETIDIIKKTGRRGRILKQIRESDHSFGTSCLSIIGAMIRGYFPLANLETEKAA